MSDKYEPYLEPLFIPGVMGVLLGLDIVFDSFLLGPGARYDIYAQIYNVVASTLTLSFIPISLIILLYEALVIVKVIKPIVFVKTKSKFYKFLRWLLAGMGVLAILSITYILLIGFLIFSGGDFKPG